MNKNDNYDLLKETYSIVGRVEEKLDKMDERVTGLEIWRAEIIGKLAVVTAVMSLAFSAGFEVIKEKIMGKS